jgi:hypothetical protein
MTWAKNLRYIVSVLYGGSSFPGFWNNSVQKSKPMYIRLAVQQTFDFAMTLNYRKLIIQEWNLIQLYVLKFLGHNLRIPHISPYCNWRLMSKYVQVVVQNVLLLQFVGMSRKIMKQPAILMLQKCCTIAKRTCCWMKQPGRGAQKGRWRCWHISRSVR